MAHYAFLDENKVVTHVIVGKDEGHFDWEAKYSLESGQVCKRTSYNTRLGIYYDPETNLPAEDQSKALRKNYAGVGYVYDWDLDGFIPPKPYPSWVLNPTTCGWEAPVPQPECDGPCLWDEPNLRWKILVEQPSNS